MEFILLANFKSHKTVAEVENWLKTVSPVAQKHQDKVKVLIAPSFVHLPLAAELLTNRHTDKPTSRFADFPSIYLCSQDVSPFPPGAYTGAVSAVQLADLRVKYCLVGHSERRRYFHESSSDIANKVANLLDQKIIPAVCVSESDIVPQFGALTDDLKDRCLYCFEPPDDIGGTVTAPPETIQAAVQKIKQHTSAPILYGGSVNPDNITSLLPLGLDGALVATACLDPDQFNRIIEKIAHAR